MLDAFSIQGGLFFRDANGPQEIEHEFVPLSGLCGEGLTRLGQSDRGIGLGFDVAFFLQAGDDFCDGDVTDSEHPGEVDDAAFSGACDQVVNAFDVVFRRLAGVIAAGSPIRSRRLLRQNPMPLCMSVD